MHYVITSERYRAAGEKNNSITMIVHRSQQDEPCVYRWARGNITSELWFTNQRTEQTARKNWTKRDTIKFSYRCTKENTQLQANTRLLIALKFSNNISLSLRAFSSAFGPARSNLFSALYLCIHFHIAYLWKGNTTMPIKYVRFHRPYPWIPPTSHTF